MCQTLTRWSFLFKNQGRRISHEDFRGNHECSRTGQLPWEQYSKCVHAFVAFYEDRIARGLPAEKKKCIFTKGGYTEKDVEKLILGMPFKRFEDMDFMHHARVLGTIKIDKVIWKRMTEAEVRSLREYCLRALERYFGN